MWLLEPILDAVIEVVLIKLFYWPGWLVLRCLTLGRYPPAAPETPHNKGFVAVTGLAACLAPGIALLLA